MDSDNTDVVRAAFSFVSIPGDPEPMIAASAPDFEMHLRGITGEQVHYAGVAGIREFFHDVSESWESFRFEATEIRELGDRVLVLADVRARGRASGAEVVGRWAWIVEVSDGKAASLRGFVTHGEALAAAGLAE
jgi:ketosteroid isomerase-like protein